MVVINDIHIFVIKYFGTNLSDLLCIFYVMLASHVLYKQFMFIDQICVACLTFTDLNHFQYKQICCELPGKVCILRKMEFN